MTFGHARKYDGHVLKKKLLSLETVYRIVSYSDKDF